MTNKAHASLVGSELHEPKGIETAAIGQVYVANGSSSGAWTTVTGLTFTGMVADFLTPVAPSGWLELDGSVISTTTYSALFNAVSIQGAGNRTGGLAVITGLPTTTGMKVGYKIFGTGITAGTTILSVDSSTQVTMSANATSTGNATVFVSPWAMGSGTFTLPDVTSSGRYRRSRYSGANIGLVQGDQLQAHAHNYSGTTGGDSGHYHAGTTGSENQDHTHTVPNTLAGGHNAAFGPGVSSGESTTTTSNGQSNNHNHNFQTGLAVIDHFHGYSGTTGATGGSDHNAENRPVSLVLMTCVKT